MRRRAPAFDSFTILDRRERVLELVRRHGWNATSFQVLEPDFRYFFDDDDACVAYVDTGRAWVAAGAPLADETRVAEVAATFVAAARAANRQRHLLRDRGALRVPRPPSVRSSSGSRPSGIRPDGRTALRRNTSLREQLRRARAKGVRVRAVDPTRRGRRQDQPGQPSRIWSIAGCAARARPPGFPGAGRAVRAASGSAPVRGRAGRALVGLLSVAPIGGGRRGWLLQNLLRAPTRPTAPPRR